MSGARNLLIAALVLCSCSHQPKGSTTVLSPTPDIPILNYTVQHVYPHDPTSYTEGFLFHEGHFFESSGAPDDIEQTRSIVGIDDLHSGRLDKKIELDKEKYFVEGIAFFHDKLYQLTWKNHTGFIYDAKTYQRLDTFRFANNEGWALTTDSNALIMSDGTSNLTYLDPVSLHPVKVLSVTFNGTPLDSLNELEYIKGYIYANRYLKNYIFKIDTANGNVLAKLDLTSLVQEERNKNPATDVLNGIAYNPGTDKIFVTGKLWAGIYEIAFSH
jgi:glutaminyl-peptide cyclotransferase